MPSLSFDPVASAYDATRGYPPNIPERIARAIEEAAHATKQTRFLEMGIGTGRIAFPLASLGHIFTGVDISEKMLGQLEAKLTQNSWQEQNESWGTLPTFPDENPSYNPFVRRFSLSEKPASMRLIRADMTDLPLKDNSFDVVLAVHIFHLVDGWQKAVNEVLRVLRPGGMFLHCWDRDVTPGDWSIKAKWESIINEFGGEFKRPGSSKAHVDVNALLREQGLQTEEFVAVQWDEQRVPRQSLENVTKRLWSGTWVIPDDIFTESVRRLEKWANDTTGDKMDMPVTRTRQFVISKTVVL